MGSNTLIQNILLSLCANYPPSNNSVTEPPPWKWVPEKKRSSANNEEFSCQLKTNEEIRKQMLNGKRLRVGTIPDRAPLSWVTQGQNNSLIGHGIAFEILNTLRDKLGFTYDVFVPSRRTLINEKGSILNMLMQGEVDMAAAFVPVLPNLQKELQWGTDLSHFEYVVMMNRPKESATGSGLLAPFEIEVWLLILISLVIVGPIIHSIMKLRSKLCGVSKVYSLSSCVWFVYGALMKQGSSLSPDNDSTKSIDDIANPMYQWVALEGDAIEYSVKEDNDLISLRRSWKDGKGKFIGNVDHSKIKSLITNGVLLLHERNWLNYFMLGIERAVQNEKDHCRYVLTTKSYLTRSLSFAFPKYSILPHLFNEDMLLYVESGIIKHLMTKDLPEAVICPLNLGSKERQLQNSDLFTTYAIVIIGFVLSSLVFTFEVSGQLYNRQLNKNNPNRLANRSKTWNYKQLFKCGKSITNIGKNGIVYTNGRNNFETSTIREKNFCHSFS